MASSKAARSRNRPPAAKNSTAARGSSSSRGTSSRGTSSRGAASRGASSGTSRGASEARGSSSAASRAQQRRPAPVVVEEPPAGPPAWLRIVSFLLALAGLGVSIYLTYTHYTGSTLLDCSEKAGAVDCTKVTTSPQSMIFGVIPVAVTGLVFYVFVAGIMSPWAWKSTWVWMPRIRLAAMVAGVGMVLYLVYAELFQIGAICLYCTSVHAITFLLFALVVVSAALWGLAPAPERPAEAS